MSTDNPFSSERSPLGPIASTGAHDLPRTESPHARKFRMVLGVLGVIAVVAVAVTVVIAVTTRTPAPATPWSAFQPDSSGNQGVWEIAQYISPYYRTSGSQQLDAVVPVTVTQSTTGGGLSVAVNNNPTGKQSLGLLDDTATVGYEICGLGPAKCDVGGTASEARLTLLRREAFELALYTFEYIRRSQTVVVVLPPGHTVTASGKDEQSVTAAVAFSRAALEPFLKVPIGTYLSQDPLELSELSEWSKSSEATLVNEVTAHALYTTKVEALQEGGSELVLTQLPAQ